MEKKPEKQLDRELKKLFQAEGLEQPPSSFAQNVMQKVKKEHPHAISIQPLFNRKQWIWVIGFVVVSVGISFFTNTEMPGQIGQFLSEGIMNLSISKTFVYSLMIFTVFLFVQIYFIKNKMEQIYK